MFFFPTGEQFAQTIRKRISDDDLERAAEEMLALFDLHAGGYFGRTFKFEGGFQAIRRFAHYHRKGLRLDATQRLAMIADLEELARQVERIEVLFPVPDEPESRFGYTFEGWMEEVEAALRFVGEPPAAEFEGVNFRWGWEAGYTPTQAVETARTIRDRELNTPSR